MPNGSRIAIIDADGLLYATALSAEMCAKGQDDGGGDMWFQVRSDEECCAEIEDKLDKLASSIKAEDMIVCLTDIRNFRLDILPTYKGNRKATRRPPMMATLRAHLLDHQDHGLRVLNIETLEADDVCGITSTALQRSGKREPVVCSPDKDLLGVHGILHRNGHTFEISVDEANRFHLYQTLVGDVVDGYTGLYGVGTKRADAILDSAEDKSVAAMWRVVLAAFVTRGYTEEDALQQARVARILRVEDWDPVNKKVKLWSAT
jgi:DNA polymerase-1